MIMSLQTARMSKNGLAIDIQIRSVIFFMTILYHKSVHFCINKYVDIMSMYFKSKRTFYLKGNILYKVVSCVCVLKDPISSWIVHYTTFRRFGNGFRLKINQMTGAKTQVIIKVIILLYCKKSIVNTKLEQCLLVIKFIYFLTLFFFCTGYFTNYADQFIKNVIYYI